MGSNSSPPAAAQKDSRADKDCSRFAENFLVHSPAFEDITVGVGRCSRQYPARSCACLIQEKPTLKEDDDETIDPDVRELGEP